MRERVRLVALCVFAGGVGGLLATQVFTVVAGVVAGVAALYALVKLDSWQRLYVIAIVLLFCATSSFPILVGAAYYARYAAVAVLAFWTWSQHQDEARPLRESSPAIGWLVKGLWLAVLVSFLSVLWSIDRETTILQAIALAALATIVHGLVTRRWRTGERIAGDLSTAALALSALFAVGIGASALGLVDPSTAGTGATPRFRVLYDNPNSLGISCALVFPILWGLWRHSRRRVYLLAMLPTAASLIMCQSRTSLVAVGIAFAVVVARNSAGRTKVVVGAVVFSVAFYAVSILGLVGSAPFATNLAERFTTNGGNGLLTDRMVAWGAAFDQWQANPVGGVGYSAGPALFASLRDAGRLVFSPDVVHNSYLQWLLELGILGLLPLLVLMRACGAVAFHGRLNRLGSGLVPAVVAGLLIQLTESAMFGTGQAYPFLFWLVVTGALINSGVSTSVLEADTYSGKCAQKQSRIDA